MPSVSYYNRTAPFWDFVANLEEQGASHPFFNRGGPSDSDNERPNPWTEGWTGFPWGAIPHRGRPDPRGPPPPPGAEDETMNESGPSDRDAEKPAGPCGEKSDDDNGPHHHGRHGRHGHHHAHGRGGPHRHGRGGFFGGRGRHGGPPFHPYGFGSFGPLAEMFQSQIFGEGGAEKSAGSQDFKPEADVFDTPEAFVVHVSLPGAKKEDVGVNWDADKSELSIASVVYRPGDEEFLKTLALDERKVGVFERKIRLGSRANPAQVDVDGITAKMEDGVLRVEVPKQDAGYVEIKKVDIE